MFEIAGSHVAALNDSDLRTLIARLCEAELRGLGLPVSAVTAGGDQNAADGGIDVRVDLPPSASVSGFIPRPTTGFQVKVPKMPPSAILKEMSPKGTVRQAIQELASAAGAYIIVSAKDSVSSSALGRRCKAMRDAVASVQNSTSMHVDFYDCERVASWIRDHLGIVAWVRERIGQPIPGWRPYASWAASAETVDSEYLLDGKIRLHDWRSPHEGGLPVDAGIRRVREVLVRPKGVVRLVGLSGVGKTRLVQALFDDRVGDGALDPAIAVYSDLAYEPEPSPRDLMRRFVGNRQRFIVIVDNCPPETHRALVTICSEPESTLSLITVEYDVRDDCPEGTEVFRLEPASAEVIEQILERCAPHVSQVDRPRIAQFSDGNARLALALAHTVQAGESLANLRDNDLFERLFHQRHAPNDNLLRAAEACSLVYSFDGETMAGGTAELPILAGLAGLPVDELYRCVANLHSRDLVQCRGVWRAILPQGLAISLAHRALERIAPQRIETAMLREGSERLLRSFSRRLGYLHDSKVAQSIVVGWLAPGGLLADIGGLNQLEIAMFENVAPVSPVAALEALESAASGESGAGLFDVSNSRRGRWIYLLRSLAYDPELFQRATLLLARFAAAEPEDFRNNSARGVFKSLFQLCWSGTHASIDQRLGVVNNLIGTDDVSSRACGLDALDGLLKTRDFNSFRFNFGARPRDYGWHPASRNDVIAWYRIAIDQVQRLTLSHGPLSTGTCSILASNFRGLWIDGGMADELESTARVIAARRFWIEGWIAVRSTIRLHARELGSEDAARLGALAEELQPRGLLQTARAYLFSRSGSVLDVADGEPAGNSEHPYLSYQRVEEATEMLGCEIATKLDILEALLPELVRSNFDRTWSFGRGLAASAEALPDLWRRLVDTLTATPEGERNIQLLRGFLHTAGVRDGEATGTFLDAAIDNPILGPWFPALQASVGLDVRGAERLAAALKLGLASSMTYRSLALGDGIPGSTRRRLLLGIASLPAGYEVAVDILGMQLGSPGNATAVVDNELVLCGRELARNYRFEHPGQMDDHYLGRIVDTCIVGDDAAEDATLVCRNLNAALSSSRAYTFQFNTVLESLFRAQPVIALDEFLGNPTDDEGGSRLTNFDFNGRSPLEMVPQESLIAWAQVDPVIRFPRLASAIVPFTKREGEAELSWTPLAIRLLDSAPDRLAVLSTFGSHLYPHSGSGSLAQELENRRVLPRTFLSDADQRVVAWARTQDAELVRLAKQERLSERRTDGSFE